MTEVIKCTIGSSTAYPCPRPGTLPFWTDGSGPRVCDLHGALGPLEEEARDLGLALEELEELEERARKADNRPLRGVVERARAEFSERLELLEENTQTISRAGR